MGACLNTIQRCVLTVKNKTGLHALPAAAIVGLTNKYIDCEVTAEKDGEIVNAKSIMGIMMLEAGQNAKVTFEVSGPSAATLIAGIRSLFEHNFEG